MATIRRLAHSCLLVEAEHGTTLFDPGFFSWGDGPGRAADGRAAVDLDELGEVQQVCITHEHADHVEPEFVSWLVDRGQDVTVHAPQSVVDLLAGQGVRAETGVPAGMAAEDVEHEILPDGSSVPNRSWTIIDVLTHPGDSFQPTQAAPVLALPLLTPWGSATAAVEFARSLDTVAQVVPVHDFYLTEQGRQFVAGIVQAPLEQAGIEVLALDWGASATV